MVIRQPENEPNSVRCIRVHRRRSGMAESSRENELAAARHDQTCRCVMEVCAD
jgi:hypothetical protein